MGLRKGQTNRGSFQKGVSGNPAGRPKGSKNKFTKQTKEYMRMAIEKHIQLLTVDLEKMSPKDRVAAMTAMLKYLMPTKKEEKKQIKGNLKIDVSYSDNYEDVQKELDNTEDAEYEEDENED